MPVCLYHAFCVRVMGSGLAVVEKDGDWRDLECLYLLARLMELLVNKLLSMAIVAVARAIFYSDLSDTGSIFGQGCAHALEA
ncbi:hypothetical protein DPMN_018038 [Dreissena polymorpha]|uniref:Uncharacterized protein n=1 Tax=Dreissena polymorpha TaxID=45954 RepID=A0A9D4NFU7_DREPO|nr:hypothetical protein DPMN_018038 [Dreissena polymorpha]